MGALRAPATLLATLSLAGALCAPAGAETIVKGPAKVVVSGALTPKALPRKGTAPVSVSLAGKISSTHKGPLPQLRGISFAINSHGHLDLSGLPVCRVGHIQPSSNQEAIEACGSSLIGTGDFAANVKLPEQTPFPSVGKLLAFNGRLRGRPAIFAHVYGTQPASISYVLPFQVSHTKGTFGTVLEANLPTIAGEWGHITQVGMTLGRTYRSHGQTHSYFTAGCPAPKGFSGAPFPLVRASFEFAGGLTLSTTLNRRCKVSG
jgi:hypothetical protein